MDYKTNKTDGQTAGMEFESNLIGQIIVKNR